LIYQEPLENVILIWFVEEKPFLSNGEIGEERERKYKPRKLCTVDRRARDRGKHNLNV
jgi:hypothetical protein